MPPALDAKGAQPAAMETVSASSEAATGKRAVHARMGASSGAVCPVCHRGDAKNDCLGCGRSFHQDCLPASYFSAGDELPRLCSDCVEQQKRANRTGRKSVGGRSSA
ncbi:hypothetical protein EON66_10695 [archaeon]|nr:MAG: hypothetical protein EON66_10695 [archaeon]